MSNSWLHQELQHARSPCPPPTPGVHSNSRPSSRWCHPAISSSVVPFSSCPQSLPASQSFPMSQLFAWGGQRTGVSALASFLPKKSQGWFYDFSILFDLNTFIMVVVTQRVKCLPAMWETGVRSLGQEDPLEEEMSPHSSTLAWKIP